MSENDRIKAEEWFEKARRDFEAAKLLLQYGGAAKVIKILRTVPLVLRARL